MVCKKAPLDASRLVDAVSPRTISVNKKPRVRKWLQPRTNLLNTVPSIFLLWRHTTITSEQKKTKTPSNSLLKVVLVIKPTCIILVLSLITLKKGEGGGGRQVNN